MRRRFFLSLLPGALLLPSRSGARPFVDEQRAVPRVKAAWPGAESRAQAKFAAAGVAWPPRRVLFRGFKDDDAFEVWASGSATGALSLVHTYAVTGRSGGPGPKRREGDGQVPEGFYTVSAFNPASAFHLSLRVSYPNASDRRRKSGPSAGSDIMIHGKDVTIGCIPLGDAAIEEVYVTAVHAHAAGDPIEVHLFPARLDDAKVFTRLVSEHPSHAPFWANLRSGLEAFARTKQPLRPTIDAAGDYVFGGG